MTEIASHRGGATYWPENSARAFRETISLPVDQIEFDVQITADGVPVIFHDATVDRVTDGHGALGDKSLAEVKTLTLFRGGGRILTLEEGLTLLAPSHLTLRCELKSGVGLIPHADIVEKTLAALAVHDLFGRTVFTSFHLPTLDAVLAAAPPVKGTVWLVADAVLRLVGPSHVAAMAHDSGVGSINVRHTLLRDGMLEDLRSHGVTVGAFAVLEDDAIRWAFEAGLDVFTTDRPVAALRLKP